MRIRAAAVALMLACASLATAGGGVDDRYAGDAALRRFVDSMDGPALAVDLARLKYRKRWNELLTEAQYRIAPRGTWDESSPAWSPARAALAQAIREESVRWLDANRDEIRLVVNLHSMIRLSEDERRAAAEFFESGAGKVFQARRRATLRVKAYGLPFVIEQQPLAQLEREDLAAQRALLDLPEDGDGKVVFDFFESPAGKKLLQLQIEEWAEVPANVWGSELDATVLERLPEFARRVRAAVPGVPPASDKVYLGTVTMDANKRFSLTVEQYRSLAPFGRYTLEYGAGDLHWADIAAAAPDMRPGETRALYRGDTGVLSDRP